MSDPPDFPLPTDEEIDQLVGQLTEQAASELGLAGPDRVKSIGKAIRRALDEYIMERVARLYWKPAKQQKQQLIDLRLLLVKTYTAFRELNSEYVVAIGQLAEDAGGKLKDTVALPGQLMAVAIGITDFLDRYEPPRGAPPNIALESAVRELLPVLEELASVAAKVRWNKNTGKPPEPRSKSASALVRIVRGFPDPPSRTAILNMIEKVHKQPNRTQDDLDAIMRAYVDELDLSLLPNRRS